MISESITELINGTDKIINFIKDWQSKNDYNPEFLNEHNDKFNTEFKSFMETENILEENKKLFLND